LKLDDITPERLQNLPNKELLSLHVRVHQLYTLASYRENIELMKKLYNLHTLIVDEMLRRGMKHSSPLNIKGMNGVKV
jgi:hypothetical protein